MHFKVAIFAHIPFLQHCTQLPITQKLFVATKLAVNVLKLKAHYHKLV